MIQNSVVIHTGRLSRLGIKEQVLKDGSSVRVRIIADKGNGRYTGSVAGVKVNLSSTKSMQLGSTFLATISSKNGVIYVTPKQNEINFERNIQINIANESQLLALLESLGLPQDEVYLKLLQQMKQLEMKFDINLMKKLHNIAVRVKGSEKKATEILTILAQKGISTDEKDILQLINYLSMFEEQNENEHYKNAEQDERKNELLNQLNKKENGWFCIPYELCNIKQNEILGTGCIRLLFSDNNLNMMNVSCIYKNKKYLFNLCYENRQCSKVKFNITVFEEEKIESEIAILQKKFNKLGNKINIEWAEEKEIEGTASDSEDFFAIGGQV